MNTLNKIIVGCGFISIALACSEDYPTYATEECNLNFVYYNNSGNPYTTDEITDEMCETNFSFMYSGEEATRDTIWFDIATMGNLSNEDRPIALQQFQVNGADNAEAGTHYVAFDDPEIAQFYQIPANANRASIPVILLRNDPTLEERTVVLKFGFKENDYFKSGYDTLSMHTIYITDRLAQPSNWDELGYFGSYGDTDINGIPEYTNERITFINFIGDGNVYNFSNNEYTGKLIFYSDKQAEITMKGNGIFNLEKIICDKIN